MKKIIELKEGANQVGQLLVSSCNNGMTNNGSPYLNLVLQDKTGTIDAKLWNVTEEQVKVVVPGKVVEFVFDVINYKNNLQLKVLKVLSIDQNNIDLRDFVKESSVSKDELMKGIKYYINKIENPIINKIIVNIFKEYHQSFFEYPAATKNHHNYLGGLATHVLSMLKLAEQLAVLYPLLSSDLLYAGIILHDIGKVEELSGPFLTEYTINGKLLGHISIMNAKLYKIASDLNLEETNEVTLLSHLILSHHGKNEYGSPVLPQIAEAEILHYIDNVDARMESIKMAYETTEENTFTSRIFPLENRQFFKHNK